MARNLYYLLLISVAMCSAYFISSGQLPHLLKRFVPLYVGNHGTSDVLLYDAEATAKEPVAALRPGGWLRYRYSGSEGRWLYVSDHKGVRVVREGATRFGVVISGRFFALLDVLLVLTLICVGLLAMGILRLGRVAAQRRTLLAHAEKAQWKARALEEKVQRLRVELDVVESQKKAQETRVFEQAAQLEKLSLDKHAAIRRYEQRLSSSEAMLEEFVQRRDVEVKDLELSLQRVTAEFDTLIEDVRYYDVNYHDTKFDSLLKGRQFEIAVARRFTVEHGCKILEWTPDKGALFNLWSEQSGNPDLLLQAPSGQKFAVECKFRSFYAYRAAGDLYSPRQINWATETQASRYSLYQEQAGVGVYVAIGLFGKASAPSVCIFAPLTKLIFESKSCLIYFSSSTSSHQLCVKHAEIRELTTGFQDMEQLIPQLAPIAVPA